MAKPNSYGVCLYKIAQNDILILLNKTSSISDLNFFKGKQEENETIKETAIREMFEETNILIEEKKLEEFFFQTTKRKNIGVFLVDVNTIDISKMSLQEEEIYSEEWISIKEETKKLSKNQRKLYLKVSSFLFMKLPALNIINCSK